MRGTLHFDGGCRGNGKGGPAAFAAILSLEADGEHERVVGQRLPSGATNNVAEYAGLIAGLECALDIGVTDLTVYGDSRLIIEQAAGRWKVKADSLRALNGRARDLAGRFEHIRFEWIPRASNARADRVVNSVLDGEDVSLMESSPALPATVLPPRGDAELGAIAVALEDLARQLRKIAEQNAVP